MKNKIIFLFVAVSVAFSNFCANAANLVPHADKQNATALQQSKAPLVLDRWSVERINKFASHWSHSSHSSHSSHYSHVSSRY